MSRYSLLTGFAYNAAQQFATAANHFARLAWRHAEPMVTIDLLTGRIEPPPFQIERNELLVRRCAAGLASRITHSAPVPAVLTAAELRVVFDLSTTPAPPAPARPEVIAARFVVRLRDERGREHLATLEKQVIVQC